MFGQYQINSDRKVKVLIANEKYKVGRGRSNGIPIPEFDRFMMTPRRARNKIPTFPTIGFIDLRVVKR